MQQVKNRNAGTVTGISEGVDGNGKPLPPAGHVWDPRFSIPVPLKLPPLGSQEPLQRVEKSPPVREAVSAPEAQDEALTARQEAAAEALAVALAMLQASGLGLQRGMAHAGRMMAEVGGRLAKMSELERQLLVIGLGASDGEPPAK